MAAGDQPAAGGDVSPVTSLYQSLILSVVSLREALSALSQSFDSDDITAAAAAVSEVLDSAVAAVAEAADGSDGDEAPRLDAAARASEELLNEVHAFLSCPSNQMAIDALSLVLPRPVAKLGALALSRRDTAAAIIKFFVTKCSLRDMLSILCEALDIQMELPDVPAYFVLLLNGHAEGKGGASCCP